MEHTETEEVQPCWLCLSDEPDENDKLTVRDCSCKGDTDAGYAHLSCLFKYATKQSDKVADNETKEFVMAWAKCTNCNQPYQHELANKLADALLKYINDTYHSKDKSSYYNQVRLIEALQVKLNAIYTMEIPCPTKLKKEGINAANQILSIVDEMKTNRIDIMILLGINHEKFQKDIIDGNQSYACKFKVITGCYRDTYVCFFTVFVQLLNTLPFLSSSIFIIRWSTWYITHDVKRRGRTSNIQL